MSPTRRNTITRDAALQVLVIAIASAVAAALAGCEPTGNALPDALLTGGTAALVTWLGASAPWWTLVAGSAVAAVAATQGPMWVLLVAWLGMGSALWIGATKSNQPGLRAGIAAFTVQVVFRLELDSFFLDSALVAFGVLGLIGVAGFLRRPRYIRRRILWSVLGVVLLVGIAGVGMGASAVQARSAATDGYQLLLDGLEEIDAGDTAAASATLRDAAVQLKSAHSDLDAAYAQPAKLVPFLAQNQSAATDVIGRAAEAAEAAASTLDLVDLEQLRIVNGRVDIDALVLLQQPLAELYATVDELDDVLHEADSPWLVGPLQDRLERAQQRADKVSHQAAALSAVAQQGPALLGDDGTPRHYLIAFTNTAEARGTAGLMGNWSVLSIDDGKLSVSQSGRTNDLENLIQDGQVTLDMSAEYFDRYGQFGAGAADEPVRRKYWGNATMTPDMPTVGAALAQMYEGATGEAIDGVIVLDPAGLAALLDVTGPIDVEGLDFSLSSKKAEQFLLVDQYAIPEAEREAILEAITDGAVEALLSEELPTPTAMIGSLSKPALEGHLSVWVTDPAVESMISLVGIDGALPRLDGVADHDGLAVVTNNASANKIDSFLQRSITYTAESTSSTGHVDATLVVTLTNTATTELASYIIDNKVGLPQAYNRTLLSVYSPLTLTELSTDAAATPTFTQTELGWKVYSAYVDIAPGESVTFTFTLEGAIEPGDYSLIYRPQSMPLPDEVTITVEQDGEQIIDESGKIARRSLIDAAGVRAWR